MPKRKALSTVVADSLLAQIQSGQLAPGTQLPTEAELCVQFEVSRTVIREAVARLRHEGLVIPQQGRGVFVSEAPQPSTFSIPQEALSTLPETIALLELRLAVEVEAAGLCAERRTAEDARKIRELMEQVDAGPSDPNVVQIHYDYDFHLMIATGAKNEFIHAFLTYLRPIITPRFRLSHVVSKDVMPSYFGRIHSEHDAVVTAIERQDPLAARRAMRIHLQNSLERVKALARASGIADAGPNAKATTFFEDLIRR
ncbi:FadR/GntR family transcriptional regulator [Phaeovulum sp.]|uniref:FadR/GntR family transcriptional regulator n=1 Tax=Phaeovulum sp. TaxID=2934796 RepID=UPI0039E3B96C